MAPFFIYRGIWTLQYSYDTYKRPLLSYPKWGHCDLLSWKYRSKCVFWKRTLIWSVMDKYQMYSTFWTPLGHNYLHFKNYVTVTYVSLKYRSICIFNSLTSKLWHVVAFMDGFGPIMDQMTYMGHLCLHTKD